MKIFLAGVFTLITSAAPAEGQSPSVESVLAANHQAVGDVPSSGAVELTYRYASSGLVGTQTKRFDLAISAFTEIDDLGGIRFGIGYDGRVPWQQDLSGTYTPQ